MINALNVNLLEMISIVSFDLWSRHFSVFLLSDLLKLFGIPLVFLSKSPFKLNIKIKVS